MLIQALLDAREGASGANADRRLLASVDGGTIAITSAGDIDQTGTAPLIRTTGDVSLTAEDDIGQATGALLVQGGDERRPASSGAIPRRGFLSVRPAAPPTSAPSRAAGSWAGSSVTATSVDADIHVTQTAAAAAT